MAACASAMDGSAARAAQKGSSVADRCAMLKTVVGARSGQRAVTVKRFNSSCLSARPIINRLLSQQHVCTAPGQSRTVRFAGCGRESAALYLLLEPCNWPQLSALPCPLPATVQVACTKGAPHYLDIPHTQFPSRCACGTCAVECDCARHVDDKRARRGLCPSFSGGSDPGQGSAWIRAAGYRP